MNILDKLITGVEFVHEVLEGRMKQFKTSVFRISYGSESMETTTISESNLARTILELKLDSDMQMKLQQAIQAYIEDERSDAFMHGADSEYNREHNLH